MLKSSALPKLLSSIREDTSRILYVLKKNLFVEKKVTT